MSKPSIAGEALAKIKVRVFPGVNPLDSTNIGDLAARYGEAFKDSDKVVVARAVSDGTHYVVTCVEDIKCLCDGKAEEYGIDDVTTLPKRLWEMLKDKVAVGTIKPPAPAAAAA